MKEKGRKIAGILIILMGILEVVVGIKEGQFSAIPIALGFCIIGSLYVLEKR